MRKEDKSTIIEQIAATVKEYGHFYLVDTTAMNAATTSMLRRECFKADIKLMVVKNTLLHKALESLEEDFSPLYGSLKGTTAVMFSDVANAPAKLIKDKAKNGIPGPHTRGRAPGRPLAKRKAAFPPIKEYRSVPINHPPESRFKHFGLLHMLLIRSCTKVILFYH